MLDMIVASDLFRFWTERARAYFAAPNSTAALNSDPTFQMKKLWQIILLGVCTVFILLEGECQHEVLVAATADDDF